MQNKTLKTARLRAELLEEKNCRYVLDLYGDVENIKLLHGIDAAQDIQLSIECSQQYQGTGAYLIFENDSNIFLGVGGVQKQEPMIDGPLAMPEHDLEFLIILDHKAKGKGYATEFCEVFFENLFNTFPNLTIPARTNKENVSCIKLLKKFGFQEEGETFYHNYANPFTLLKNNMIQYSALKRRSC